MRTFATVFAVVASAGCLPLISVPLDADIACQSADECPPDMTCIEAGRCIFLSSPCLSDEGQALPSGNTCELSEGGEGLCILGHCRPSSCGDGVLDPAAEELCDDGALNSDHAPGACRSNCTLPFCGDGVIDPGEGCDGALVGAECTACALVCARDTGDCNGQSTDGCECGVLVSDGLGDIASMRADETSIYWAVGETLYRAPRGKVNVYEVLSTDLSQAYGVRLDSDHVYIEVSEGVVRVPKTGGVPQTVSTETFVDLLHVSPQHVYYHDDATFSGSDEIRRRSTTPPFVMEAVAVGVESDVLSLTTDGAFIFYATDDGVIFRVPADLSEQPQPIADRQPRPSSLVVNEHGLFWLNVDSLSVMHLPEGAPAPTTLASGQHARELAYFDGALYWTTYPGFSIDGAVMTQTLDAPTPRMLARTGIGAFDIHVDARGAVWVSAIDERVSSIEW